jgi:hypothetical protein
MGGRVTANEQFLKMANESGFVVRHNKIACDGAFVQEQLGRFFRLVQAATAEECAKVCDEAAKNCATYLCRIVVEDVAEGIRAVHPPTPAPLTKEQ